MFLHECKAPFYKGNKKDMIAFILPEDSVPGALLS